LQHLRRKLQAFDIAAGGHVHRAADDVRAQTIGVECVKTRKNEEGSGKDRQAALLANLTSRDVCGFEPQVANVLRQSIRVIQTRAVGARCSTLRMPSALTVASSMLRRRPSMCRLYLQWRQHVSHSNATMPCVRVQRGATLFQRRADVLLKIVNDDKVREMRQNILDFQAFALLHDFDGGLDGLAVLDGEHRNLQPQSLAQHLV
jgi:hypothetical protein